MTYTYLDYINERDKLKNLYIEFQKLTRLSNAEFWCIIALERWHCHYQYEICQKMFMNKQTVNSALLRLHEKNLITTEQDTTDQRQKRIVLSPTGRAFYDSKLKHLEFAEDTAWSMLTPDEQEQLLLSMKKLNEALHRNMFSDNE